MLPIMFEKLRNRPPQFKEVRTNEDLQEIDILFILALQEGNNLPDKLYRREERLGVYRDDSLEGISSFYKGLNKGVAKIIVFVDPMFCVARARSLPSVIYEKKDRDTFFVGVGVGNCMSNGNNNLRVIARERYLGDLYKREECSFSSPEVNEETLFNIFSEE